LAIIVCPHNPKKVPFIEREQYFQAERFSSKSRYLPTGKLRNLISRSLQSKKIDAPALAVVIKYNKYMGVVNKHDKLCSEFALGKCHYFNNIM
jgi:hypothetical protein